MMLKLEIGDIVRLSKEKLSQHSEYNGDMKIVRFMIGGIENAPMAKLKRDYSNITENWYISNLRLVRRG